MASITKKMSFSKPNISWARLVSDVMSPPVVWGVLIIVIGVHYTNDEQSALYWSGIFAFLVCFLPVSYILWMVARGKISDKHMRRRQDRYKPLMLTIISGLLTWYFFRTQGAPSAFSVLALVTVFQMATILVITFWWQISMHAMAITSVVIASAAVFDLNVAYLLVPLISLVGAARLSLNCHTPSQIFAGAMVGALVPIAVLIFLDNQFLRLV